MHIAMFSIHSSPIGELGAHDTGGMSVYIRELARELGIRGNRVDIFTAIYRENQPPVIALYPNVRLIHLPTPARIQTSIPLLHAYLPGLFERLETFRENHNITYDLIHSHYWLSGILGARAQEQWHCPHVMTFHTIAAIKNRVVSGEKEPELRLVHEKQLIETCNRIVVSSQKEKTFFIHHFHIAPEKISLIPCGVDLDRFRPMNKTDARKALNLNENHTVALYVGRFVPIKGLDRLIRAMNGLQDYRAARLIVVGGDDAESPTHQKYTDMVKDLNLNKRILFTGRIKQEKLPLYYNAVDVLILPSYHESFGLVVLEALACGTPVLTTRVGSTEMIIKEGMNGWIVDKEDSGSFAQYISGIFSRDASQTISQDRIRETVMGFSWRNAAEALLTVYENLPRNATEYHG